jgi:hypothetical protein
MKDKGGRRRAASPLYVKLFLIIPDHPDQRHSAEGAP